MPSCGPEFQPIRGPDEVYYQRNGLPRSTGNGALAVDGKVDDDRAADSSQSLSINTIVRNDLGLPQQPLSPADSSSIKADEPRLSIEDSAYAVSATRYMPTPVLEMQPLDTLKRDSVPALTEMVTFDEDFLNNFFGGKAHGYGTYVVEKKVGSGPPIVSCYYKWDRKIEPYSPEIPGEHGAKLSLVMPENPEDEYYYFQFGTIFQEVPLFIRGNPTVPGGEGRYVYFGHYTQSRWSDRLDYDRQKQCVPASVKAWWAEQLAARGCPDWARDKLREHFFSDTKPTIPDDATEDDIKRYIESLASWKKNSMLKISLLKKETILSAFDRADADEEPGLRFWWEYLECVDWNVGFYELLKTVQGRTPSYNT
ncbi:hypothetical protein CC78DRAFT_536192 [Lojkania enalia]|uniref:DUF6697 domain-containing protein n=1 Tax=Lojkania enalia TaxID=147567 RepID=A0A9P4K227_9PLEO|nr:hypothetical protein CC78DRAFT_536192 [Didymosphaeria enalia]